MNATYERVALAKTKLEPLLKLGDRHPIGLVLGSGLGLLDQSLKELLRIPYSEIPGMPKTTVIGHEGAILSGKLGGRPVLCLSGRAHLYEGHSPEDVVFGVRLLAALGVKIVLLTNAAGGISEDCSPGSLMLIEDHLNLTGCNPLVGKNDDRLGPRFPDMSEVYSSQLRSLALSVGGGLGLRLPSGVYAGLLGPSYETPAEIKMLRTMGASAVGMSTVHEAIALGHQGVEVLGLSCITNWAAGLSAHPLSHKEVSEVAQRSGTAFCSLVTGICAGLSS